MLVSRPPSSSVTALLRAPPAGLEFFSCSDWFKQVYLSGFFSFSFVFLVCIFAFDDEADVFMSCSASFCFFLCLDKTCVCLFECALLLHLRLQQTSGCERHQWVNTSLLYYNGKSKAKTSILLLQHNEVWIQFFCTNLDGFFHLRWQHRSKHLSNPAGH